jgi:ABC-type dipeptide/oligopeptide/nickel transport system permease component
MKKYFFSRLLTLIPVLALVLVVVFSLSRAIPGDPAIALLGPGASNAQIAALNKQLKLDGPATTQFFSYAAGLFQGDMGTSLKSGRPVTHEIMDRLPATLELSAVAMVMALVLGIPAGVWAALRHNGLADHVIRVVSLCGVSMPAFLLALILQLVFSIWLGWLPISGRLSPYIVSDPITGFAVLDGLLSGDLDNAWDAVLHLLLPSAVLAAFLAATVARFVRNSMIEVMGEDFIRTARAKGLADRAVVFGHGLRNALLPAITVVGLSFAEMLGGAILTETVFSWPGIGRLMFDAIRNRDYPVIQGATLIFALLFVLTSLAVDLLYGLLDPRLRRKMR